MKGDIFTNSIVSSVSECIAHLLAGVIVLKAGAVGGLCFSNALAALSAAVLWIANAYDWLEAVPFCILAGKFGTGAAFCMLYMSTLQFFENRFMGRIFGTCNVTARLMTVMSPMVAEAPDPTPELTMLFSCALAAIFTCALRKPQ